MHNGGLPQYQSFFGFDHQAFTLRCSKLLPLQNFSQQAAATQTTVLLI
tara:strand:- start:147558 stop:147701 length:144 start_codon:yes stop_codon:yes gene_type:complete